MKEMIKAVFFDLKESINDVEHILLDMYSKLEESKNTTETDGKDN